MGHATFVVRRLLHGAGVLLAVSLLVFAALYVVGNPVELLVDPQADPADIARTVAALGLDQPLWRQYLHFLGQALQGDLGRSFIHGEPALGLILERLPATLELAVIALLLALLAGIPLGLWAGLKPRSLAGRLIGAASTLGFALPAFWLGLMLILVFAVQLQWLPPGGRGATRELFGLPALSLSCLTWDGWQHLLLPALNLALYKAALVVRLVRAGSREVLGRDYVRFARAKGLSEARVVARHVLPNTLIPVVTVLGMEFGGLIAFSVVTETVFGWPGMGKLLMDAINALDRPVVVAYLLCAAALFVLLNLGVELLYGWLDPRVRESRA
ncbi:ABC transporter permease [Azospira sp. I13]|uniref:ABC transporter permease n=1 Tax=Azospira sp. I13 TaxID=1765050 RepID=UPI000D4AD68A|nr:ABC transporter permease [Azospira sp. I13]GBG02804.1 ABC transporter permease [Azospira sp. I13]